MKTVILAHSGGLDTSVAIPCLKERYDCDRVIADVGQPEFKYVIGGIATRERLCAEQVRIYCLGRYFAWHFTISDRWNHIKGMI